VVEPPTPLKNDGVSSSVGMMTFPIDGKIKHVPNHQPVKFLYKFSFEASAKIFHHVKN
jgi:hypothetical protein